MANIYSKTMEESLNAMIPNIQVIPRIGITAPNVFMADLNDMTWLTYRLYYLIF